MKSASLIGVAACRPRRRWTWLPLALLMGAYYAAPRMMARAFAPPQRATTDTPAGLGLPEEQVWLESVSGTRLHGWYIPSAGEAPAVVVLHGWGGNASLMLPLAPYLYAAGFHALFLDARNHGISEHDSFASMPRFAEDLEVAADWLRARREVTTLGVIGHSVGAGAAILSASRGSRYQAVVAVSSFAHPGEMMRDQMRSIPRILLTLILGVMQRMIGYRFDDLAPRNRIPLVDAPVMLVHGEADSVVPIGNLHELAAAHPGAELLLVPEGGHSDLAPFEPYIGDITTFLDRHLRP